MHRKFLQSGVAVAALVTGLAACSSSGTQPEATASSQAVDTSQPVGEAVATTTSSAPGGASATPKTGSGAVTVGWRGATVAVPRGWRKAAGDDNTLCILPISSPARVCQALGHTDGVQDWLFLYATERSAVQGAPANPRTLDGSDMDFWMYDGAEPPCDDWTRNQRVDNASKKVGGKTAYYGKWLVTCKDDGKSFTAQRWLLPKSRLGVISFARTDVSAAAIYQMVTTMDMIGYEPTEP